MLINPEDLLGHTLKGTYKIDRFIGKGGMGVVYHARKANSSHEFAVKVLPPKEASHLVTSIYQELFTRFQREFALIAQLKHPHIVSVYTAGLYQGTAYLVMPYLRGGTLDRRLRKNGPLSLDEALTYMQQLASAIDCIHLRGIVHRDIKPLNIMFDDQGQLMLMDFGIAHIFGSRLTKIGFAPGTPAYQSPEAKDGKAAHRCDDIYSLGVVLYEMLTNNDPTMVHQPHSSIPSAVAAVIQKATADRREDRYASAGAMAEALRIAVERIHNSPTKRDLPPQPVLPAKPLRRVLPAIFTRLGFLSTGIAVVFILGAWLTMSLFSSRAGTSSTAGDVEQARASVNDYYSNWNNNNYSATYDLLSSDYQKKNPYSILLPAYQHTHHSCVIIDNASLQPDGSVQVQVTDNAVEDPPSGGGTVINIYQVDFTVKQEQGIWKITPTLIKLLSTHGKCTSP